jgi:CRP-like cAMP-binding protein
LLKTLEMHVRLDDADRAAVRALSLRLRSLDASAYLLREGQVATHCAILLSGFAFRHKLTGDGARQITAIHIAGEPPDFQNLFLAVSDHNIQLLTRAEIAVVPRAELEALILSRPNIARAILTHVLVEASIYREWIVNVGRRDSRAALSHLLCELVVRLNARGLLDGLSFNLPLTQEQFADALGVTSVHVNRMVRTLEIEGLITRNGRRLTISNWPALQEAGDFNARYLHLGEVGSDGPVGTGRAA